MLGLLGKKLGMTRLFNEKGEPICVTVVQAGPCPVVRKKTKKTDGYDVICLGFDEHKKEKNLGKPLIGVYKKANVKACRHMREFKTDKFAELEVGKALTVAMFKKGDNVDVSGITKGCGFQGVIKRHHKRGGPAAHGSKFHRTTGSIGMRTWPGRVLPGTRMAGHMGDVKRTIKNLRIFDIDTVRNLVFIEGAVPGGKNGLLVVSTRA